MLALKALATDTSSGAIDTALVYLAPLMSPELENLDDDAKKSYSAYEKAVEKVLKYSEDAGQQNNDRRRFDGITPTLEEEFRAATAEFCSQAIWCQYQNSRWKS